MCKCNISTGIHESLDADGTKEKPYGFTFGFGELDSNGYWEHPCDECARKAEILDDVPFNSYWPFRVC